jgi:prepilin-type processing-associated H-X9-DG protein/prepilin-type N-terminal cleavage/methylation domain-containing protein
LTLIELMVVMAIIGIVIAMTIPAVQHVRATAARAECQNNLKQIALALQGFQSQHKRFPPALNTNTSDQWYLSWMGRILPFIEQDNWARTILPEYQRVYSPWGYFWLAGWGGQPPHVGLGQLIDLYKCPSESRILLAKDLDLGTGNQADTAFTDYLGVSGTDGASADGIFIVGAGVRVTDIVDGTSNTLMVGERPPNQDFWAGMWYAGAGYDGRGTGDVVLGAAEVLYANTLSCSPTQVGLQPGTPFQNCDQPHFWSFHPGGANFALADGSVRFVKYSSSPVLRDLATRNGGEPTPDF